MPLKYYSRLHQAAGDRLVAAVPQVQPLLVSPFVGLHVYTEIIRVKVSLEGELYLPIINRVK